MEYRFSLNTLGKKITDAWPIKLFSTYASGNADGIYRMQ
jgi:hypothetical protein